MSAKVITEIEGYEKTFIETVELYKEKGLGQSPPVRNRGHVP
jgi:hypothetical protein